MKRRSWPQEVSIKSLLRLAKPPQIEGGILNISISTFYLSEQGGKGKELCVCVCACVCVCSWGGVRVDLNKEDFPKDINLEK